jgi:hypothetical protein
VFDLPRKRRPPPVFRGLVTAVETNAALSPLISSFPSLVAEL